MRVTLAHKQRIADDTMAFWFQPRERVRFHAGQAADFSIPGSDDPRGSVRTFSIASSPDEEQLMVATRMREGSGFKSWLNDAEFGTELEMSGPTGRFVLPHDPARIVFLVGGIGITPVRSMISWSTAHETGHELTLVYSNRTRSSTAFLRDLEGFAKRNERFTLLPTLTDEDPENWPYEVGRIDEGFLDLTVPDFREMTCYVVGTPGFVSGVSDLLVRAGVSSSRIVTERYDGY